MQMVTKIGYSLAAQRLAHVSFNDVFVKFPMTLYVLCSVRQAMQQNTWNCRLIASRLMLYCLLVMITATFLLYPLLSNSSNTERSKPSAPTLLFDVSRMKESLVLDCITGEVIGVRPRHDMVDVHLLRPSRHTEADGHRKTIFSKIFDNRVWGKNSDVDFSASGRYCFYMSSTPITQNRFMCQLSSGRTDSFHISVLFVNRAAQITEKNHTTVGL